MLSKTLKGGMAVLGWYKFLSGFLGVFTGATLTALVSLNFGSNDISSNIIVSEILLSCYFALTWTLLFVAPLTLWLISLNANSVLKKTMSVTSFFVFIIILSRLIYIIFTDNFKLPFHLLNEYLIPGGWVILISYFFCLFARIR